MKMLRGRKRSVVLSVALLFGMSLGTVAEARKFSFQNENLSTYLHGTYGLSSLRKSAFVSAAQGLGAQSFDQSSDVLAGGEFGVLFSVGMINARIGAELLLPDPVKAGARNASNQTLFTVRSKSSAVIPTLGLEAALAKTPVSKAIIGASIGYAYFRLDNNFQFTSAGQAAYGLADFDEKSSTETIVGQGYFGYEILMVDTATLFVNLGYRFVEIEKLTHRTPITGFSGAVNKGDTVRNFDGRGRELDLSGAFAGIGFRLYL